MNFAVAGIYVINLDARPQRWETFRAGIETWKSAFDQVPRRFSAVAGVDLPGYDAPPWFGSRLSDRRKRSWGGKAGCILSHRNAIVSALEQGWGNILIVEDDAFLTAEMAQAWTGGLRSLVADLPEDWAAIYLCTTTPIPPCRAVAGHEGITLVEATGAFGTVAYLLNGRVFAHLLRELPDERSIWPWVARHKTIDRWFSRNLQRFGRVYLFAPSIAGHHTGSSDTSMTAENDWCLDFTLKDIRYEKSAGVFALKKGFRRVLNGCSCRLSIFRQELKRWRGF